MIEQVWSNWENDRSRRADGRPAEPRMSTVERIAEGLNVPVDEVLAVVLANRPARISGLSPDAERIARLYDIVSANISPERRQRLADAVTVVMRASAAA